MKVVKKENFVIDQSLVHIKHTINIRQYKYWHLMLKFFVENQHNADSDGFYYESRKTFAKYMGYEENTALLKNALEGLRREAIIINYLEKDKKPAIHGMGFISEYKITSNQIKFKLPSFVEKAVLGDETKKKMFLLLNWNVFNSFTGKYEAIIYKLCKDYANFGRTPYFTLEQWRDYLGLKPTHYNNLRNLVQKCIVLPAKVINESEYSDIDVTVSFKKQGRGGKIEGLYFEVKNTNREQLPFAHLETTAFADAMISISVKDQIKYLDAFNEDQIKASIFRANSYVSDLKAKAKPINLSAIYHKAIMDNWGKQVLEQQELERKQKEQELERKQKEQELERKQKEQELEKQNEVDQILEVFDFSDDEYKDQQIIKAMNKMKGATSIYKRLLETYNKYGLDSYKHNTALKALLINVLKEG